MVNIINDKPMRPIKFKAIRKDNGEWVFGSYHFSADGQHHYILAMEKLLLDYPIYYLHLPEVNEVLPETVCQYTGRQEIFESDFVTVEDGADGLPQEMKAGKYVVKYSELHCAFLLEQLDGLNAVIFDESSIYTVTGNIHNP